MLIECGERFRHEYERTMGVDEKGDEVNQIFP